MTYITYSNIRANLVRNCLKEPFKTESMSSEKVHFSLSKWADGKPQIPGIFFFKKLPFLRILDQCSFFFDRDLASCLCVSV
ncbi:hypothetical protein DY000_02001797 [Brassica cretica]|uniref:ATP synthase subunit epsilon, mitochondrial n=1 Tax=Brassica cretica TaxID=69181 RepID=A0ABQ7BWD3_BRACR|nr:hypothetical protein DY000_02001797 [Brassica cretica]